MALIKETLWSVQGVAIVTQGDPLTAKGEEPGWPRDVIQRARELRVPESDIEGWITSDVPVDQVTRFLDQRAELTLGTLRVRMATWADDGELADCYANAPEDIGDWEVTVDRSPYACAQFRLQDDSYIHVLEDRGVILAAWAHAVFNAVVAGQPTSVHFPSAVRVRQDHRGKGYSRYLQSAAGPATGLFGYLNAYYVRSQNVGAVNWAHAVSALTIDESAAGVPGIPVTVTAVAARDAELDPAVRPTTRRDLARCVSLINRTHRRQDLFRPYSTALLERRLNDTFWGPKPAWWTDVYGWGDHFVLTENDRVIACAGLWDRGRHVRDLWVHKRAGQERVVNSAAVLDFGYERNRADAMARLFVDLASRTFRLGRDHLLAPLDQHSELLDLISNLDHTSETRGLVVLERQSTGWTQVPLRRPHVDLSYW